jgi:hypothetical protein
MFEHYPNRKLTHADPARHPDLLSDSAARIGCPRLTSGKSLQHLSLRHEHIKPA